MVLHLRGSRDNKYLIMSITDVFNLGPDRWTAPENPPPLFYWRCWFSVRVERNAYVGFFRLVRSFDNCQIEALQSIFMDRLLLETDYSYLSVNHHINSPTFSFMLKLHKMLNLHKYSFIRLNKESLSFHNTLRFVSKIVRTYNLKRDWSIMSRFKKRHSFYFKPQRINWPKDCVGSTHMFEMISETQSISETPSIYTKEIEIVVRRPVLHRGTRCTMN